MPDPRGFLGVSRSTAPARPPAHRIGDWDSVYEQVPPSVRNRDVSAQASRCMDCAVPYCHTLSFGCPLGNLVPEWNDLVRQGRWTRASELLHATNNFPEFTGHVCPAPCESACVLAVADHHTSGSVTIKRIEQAIVDNAWESGALTNPERVRVTGGAVAVVGSGPAGLAAAQQLTRAGHRVTVFEREDRVGGLLRYGIPEFKLPKALIDRRIAQLVDEGTRFVTDCAVGVDASVENLRAEFDAIVLATGAERARDLAIAGREGNDIHQAMSYLVAANRESAGDGPTPVSARGRRVVIVGGGDTAADCLGTAHRQGALSVTELNYHAEPPATRNCDRDPWPLWPLILRRSPADEEGGLTRFRITAQEFARDPQGTLQGIRIVPVTVSRAADGRRIITPTGAVDEIECDLVILALGFEGVHAGPLLDALGLAPEPDGTIGCGVGWQTRTPGVFVCGDAHRGASLIVWAIAEGRSVARAVDVYLAGTSSLPAPVGARSLPLYVREATESNQNDARTSPVPDRSAVGLRLGSSP